MQENLKRANITREAGEDVTADKQPHHQYV